MLTAVDVDVDVASAFAQLWWLSSSAAVDTLPCSWFWRPEGTWIVAARALVAERRPTGCARAQARVELALAANDAMQG